MTSGPLLPAEFADLEIYAEAWALPLESQRNAKRIGCDMKELTAFYDAIFPRLEGIVGYLNRFPFEAIPQDARNLLSLAYSLLEVSLSVEVLGCPNMPNAVDEARVLFAHER